MSTTDQQPDAAAADAAEGVAPGPFADLIARLEARGFTAGGEDEPGEVFMAHARFEREWQRREDGSVRFDEPTDCAGELRQIDRHGRLWVTRCDACGFEIAVRIPDDRLEEYLLDRAGIPELFAGKPFDRDDAQQQPTLVACRQWIKGFRGDALPAVALWGQSGRGKSHLLSLVVETLIRRYGVEAVYRSVIPLMAELRDAISAGVFEGAYARFADAPVLALDDLGANRMTDAAREWLAGLIDHRYGRELPLLVATNIPPSAWEQAFGQRAASRLRGMCVPLRLEGPDRRSQGVQQALGVSGG